jgi:competence protein ComEC
MTRSFGILLLWVVLLGAGCGRPKDLGGPGTTPEMAKVPSDPGTLFVSFLNLERHGLSILLRTPSGRGYLVDAGRHGQGYDAGRDAIEPKLMKLGIHQLEGIVLSHPDRDHYGGAAYLLGHVPVKRVIDTGYDEPGMRDAYRKLRAGLREKGVEYQAVRAGDRLAWDESLEVEVLAPPRENLVASLKAGAPPSTNDNSLVLRVVHGKNVFLFPGDIQRAGRDSLLYYYGADHLKATVLAAPHHGFSHGRAFAHAVRPEIVVVPALAEYQEKKTVSPGQDMTGFFGAMGARVYVTGWHGDVEITSDGSSYQVKTQHDHKAD